MLFFRDGPAKIFIRFTVSGINPIITDHFEMFFGNMLSQSCNEIENRHCFGNKLVIFVTVVMESDIISIIGVNAGGCNDRF